MQPSSAQGKEWRPPGDVEDTIHVDLDESDSSKAVERVKDTRGALTVTTDEEDESPAERKFLDHSKAVRKRIGRMQRNFDQKAADQTALFQRELAERDRRISALETRRETTTPEASELERDIQLLETQLADAHEKGESKEVARLTALISKKNMQIFAAEQRKLTPAPKERQQEEPTARENKPPGPTPKGQEWIDSNIDWWEDEDFAAERFEAVRLHDKMIAGGSDPNSPKHYKKIEQRLKAKFPKLQLAGAAPEDDDDDDEVDDPPPPRREAARRAPVQSLQDRGQGNGAKTRGRGVQLSADQIANMRRFGMDPNNNAHVLQYAASAAESE